MTASEANKTWCKAVPFNHTISYTSKAGKRCTPKVVVNNMCRGRCNSFHLPGQQKSLSLHSECRASSTVEETVELHCPFSKKKRIRHIKIQKILSCECIQCAKKHWSGAPLHVRVLVGCFSRSLCFIKYWKEMYVLRNVEDDNIIKPFCIYSCYVNYKFYVSIYIGDSLLKKFNSLHLNFDLMRAVLWEAWVARLRRNSFIEILFNQKIDNETLTRKYLQIYIESIYLF